MFRYETKEKDVTKQQEYSTLSQFPNVNFHVVAIAASAGGLKAISKVLSALPPNFPAAIIVVQHLSPDRRSYLAEILGRRTPLWVKQAKAGDLLHPGRVYIAAPGRHLILNLNGTLSFSDTAKVNFVRPSANVLFESLAASFKAQAIAIVLTGGAGDGAIGVEVIKQQGGTVIAQDEATSECFSMPKSAIKMGCVDFVLPLDAIAATLIGLVTVEETA